MCRNDAGLGVRRIVHFCHTSWECLIVAVLTLRKPAKVVEGGRYGTLHCQRTLYTARAARTFASNLQAVLQNVPNRLERIASGENVAIRDDEHLKGIREHTVALPKIRRCCNSGRCNPLRSRGEFVVENSFDFLQIALFSECLSDCADLAICRIDCILYD